MTGWRKPQILPLNDDPDDRTKGRRIDGALTDRRVVILILISI